MVQGLTEFLPVSSSGHLIVVPWLFGWTELTRNPELNRAFDVALHMGTLVGALIYFWSDLMRLVFRERRLGVLLLISAVPGALVGALLKSTLEDRFGAEWLIGVMLVVFGLVLLWADRLKGDRGEDEFRARD